MSDVYITYGRAVNDPSATTPLIAVLKSEAEAEALERRLMRTGRAARVEWQEIPLHEGNPDGSDLRDGKRVHIVSIGGLAGDESSQTRARDAEFPISPVALGVFTEIEQAQAYAAECPESHIRIRSLPIGWIDLAPIGLP